MNFSYEQTTKIVFGRGKIDSIGEIASQYGKNVLLVTESVNSPLAPLYERVKGLLQQAGLTVHHYDGVVPNPTTESVDAGTQMARSEKVDAVIGIGGGSQVTQVAVMTETATQTKSAVFNNLIYPRVAIVDPDLMVTVPRHTTASTGFDAFCHCFESYINVNGSAYTDIIALEGIRMVAKYLRRVVKDGQDLEAREGMAWADTCGGLAIANAGVTLPHGVGMTISGHCPQIMHGESLALTYPSFMRLTYPAAVEKFATVGRILNPELSGLSDEEAAKRCCEEVDQLLKDIGMWLNFESFSVDEATIRRIADRSHDLPDYKANPVIADIDEIYRELMEALARS